jgi:hypothetical protein
MTSLREHSILAPKLIPPGTMLIPEEGAWRVCTIADIPFLKFICHGHDVSARRFGLRP